MLANTADRLEISPEEIRALRKRAGLKQQEFADVLGVTQSIVSAWERGEKSPTEQRVAVMYQWRKRLDQAESKEAETNFTRTLLRSAAQAGILAVLLRIFGGSK